MKIIPILFWLLPFFAISQNYCLPKSKLYTAHGYAVFNQKDLMPSQCNAAQLDTSYTIVQHSGTGKITMIDAAEITPPKFDALQAIHNLIIIQALETKEGFFISLLCDIDEHGFLYFFPLW